MTQEIAERQQVSAKRDLPREQLELIRKTVANGATDLELQLFLHDCARRGIHPLDKLLHFTKRGGKYTPVTSIDFMRSQAAATGEMAGSDDPRFEYVSEAHPESATVTVYRLTQGQRFAYTATARWSEYCPENAQMWRRMPCTMLGKCAEALALRKAFPQQLAGLYAREELDQAEKSGYSVEAPVKTETRLVAGNEHAKDGDPVYAEVPVEPDPADGLRIRRVDVQDTRNANVKKYICVLSDGREVSTINPALGTLAQNLCQDGVAVLVVTKATKWGEDLTAIHRAGGGGLDDTDTFDPPKDLPF